MNNAEADLFAQAVTALGKLGLPLQTEIEPAGPAKHRADARMRIRLDGRRTDYTVECKRTLPVPTLGAVVMRLQQIAVAEKRTPLLVTTYVPPPMAERLREQDQQFIDVAGNAYLRGRSMLVYVTGRKPGPALPLVRPGRAFTTAGLKVLFALLANPKLAEAPLRTLAGVAGVALGATPPILAGLEKEGHLLVAKRKRHLNPTRRLLDEWAAAYARTLRPKTLTTILVAPAFDQWKVWNLRDAGVRWGGEPAAHLMVGHLRPGILTLYANRLPPRLIVEQRLIQTTRPAGERHLELRAPFWGDAMLMEASTTTVVPTLVYADLLATGEARCLETAGLVYDRHLAQLYGRT